MKNLYFDTRILDEEARKQFFLTEEIMMENAACALQLQIESYISNQNIKKPKILILCGKGNNGADGFTLARRISKKFQVIVIETQKVVSGLCAIQKKRFLKTEGKILQIHDFLQESKEKTIFTKYFSKNKNFKNVIIVDCIFGSGFHGEFSPSISPLLDFVNKIDCFKIACDIPSGISLNGLCAKNTFKANLTVTCGALKFSLYSDFAKDFTGKIVTADLGVDIQNFQKNSIPDAKLLEKSDLILPNRTKNLVNKGSFGHVVSICGEKIGASSLSSLSALTFGCGKTTLVSENDFSNQMGLFKIPLSLMTSQNIPQNVNAIVFGPGFGLKNDAKKYFDFLLSNPAIPCVLDADAFYFEQILKVLKSRPNGIILTPHPKEFLNLLKIANLVTADFSISDILEKKYELCELFCTTFPDTVLILKGSNPLISTFSKQENESFYNLKVFVNPLGFPSLAKAGSGDVLSGLCAGLLAQNYSPLQSAISSSLAHALASQNEKNNFSLTAEQLIQNIANLTSK